MEDDLVPFSYNSELTREYGVKEVKDKFISDKDFNGDFVTTNINKLEKTTFVDKDTG